MFTTLPCIKKVKKPSVEDGWILTRARRPEAVLRARTGGMGKIQNDFCMEYFNALKMSILALFDVVSIMEAMKLAVASASCPRFRPQASPQTLKLFCLHLTQTPTFHPS